MAWNTEKELEQLKAKVAQAEAVAEAAAVKQEQITRAVDNVVKSKAVKAAASPEIQSKFKDDKVAGADSKTTDEAKAKSPAEIELEEVSDRVRENEVQAEYADKLKAELRNKAEAAYDRSKEPEKPATKMRTTIDHELAEERMKAKELENEQSWRKQAEAEKSEKSKVAGVVSNAVNKVKQATSYAAPDKVDSGAKVRASSNHDHKSSAEISAQLEQSKARVRDLEIQKKAMDKVDKAIEGKPPYEQLKTLEAIKMASKAKAANLAVRVADLEKEVAAEKAAGKEDGKANEAAIEVGNQNQSGAEHETVGGEEKALGEKGVEADYGGKVQMTVRESPENEQSKEAPEAPELDKGSGNDLNAAFSGELKQVQSENAASKSNDGPDYEP